jgi:hypothetical protein
MTSVKVAVRVRPFNQRPEEQSSTCIIDMVDNQTTITNPVNFKKYSKFILWRGVPF